MATTKSPTSSLVESPSGIWMRLSGGTLSTATSEGTSLPTTVAVRSRPSCRVTVISVALSTTCAFVTMYPFFASKMTPEPALWNWRSRGPMSGMSKNRRKKGSSSSGFCGVRSRMVPRVAMFTTAGETRLIMGASVGTGVSPTAWGSAAWLRKGEASGRRSTTAHDRVWTIEDMAKRILKR